MNNDFKPVVNHRFNLRADWGAVDCQVMAVEPNKTLSYTWAAYGLESVVTWTLTPTSSGTRLRMEQSGFRPDQQQAYQGAKGGWQRFFAALEQVLAPRIEVRRRNSKLAWLAHTAPRRGSSCGDRQRARRDRHLSHAGKPRERASKNSIRRRGRAVCERCRGGRRQTLFGPCRDLISPSPKPF